MQSFRLFHLITAIAAGGITANVADGAFALFSTTADNNIYALTDTSGSMVGDVWITDQSVQSAVKTDGHVIFSTVGQTGTFIVNPNAPGLPASSVYSSGAKLGLAASGPTNVAMGNLTVQESGSTYFYRLDPAGPVYFEGTPALAVGISNGKALYKVSYGLFNYNLDSGVLSGNLGGSSMTRIAGAGDSERFMTNIGGGTYVTQLNTVTLTISGTAPDSVYGSKDLLFTDIHYASGFEEFGAWDTRSNTWIALGSKGNDGTSTPFHLVAVGNSNVVFYSHGGDTVLFNGDTNIKTGYSSEQLVSGFSFGDYALLGLRSVDGTAGRAVVVDMFGNEIAEVASSQGNDLAAYVTGAGVASVPEPAALSALAFGTLLLRRRRK